MSDDQALAALLQAIRDGEGEATLTLLAERPEWISALGPHPYWGGQVQALHMAVEGGNQAVFEALLAAGADPSGDNEAYDHWSPLMLAVNEKRPEMLEALLAAGAKVGLAEALLLKDDAAVDRLLDAGGIPDMAPNGGSFLALARTPHAIDRLLALGVDTDSRDRWRATPIEAISRSGPDAKALVRQLMAHGLVPEPAEFARMDDREGLEAAIARDAAVLADEAVMMAAVDFGHHDLVRWLITQGADVNARTTAATRHTALHSAAWNGDLDMARLLVEAGADLEAVDDEHGGTPAGWAEVSATVTHNPRAIEVAHWLAERGG